MPLFVCALAVCPTSGTVICFQAQMGLGGSAARFSKALELVGRWVGAPCVLGTCPSFADALLELCEHS